jgi:hypothetical protein
VNPRESFHLFLTPDMLLLSITFFYTGLQVSPDTEHRPLLSRHQHPTLNLQMHLRPELWWPQGLTHSQPTEPNKSKQKFLS